MAIEPGGLKDCMSHGSALMAARHFGSPWTTTRKHFIPTGWTTSRTSAMWSCPDWPSHRMQGKSLWSHLRSECLSTLARRRPLQPFRKNAAGNRNTAHRHRAFTPDFPTSPQPAMTGRFFQIVGNLLILRGNSRDKVPLRTSLPCAIRERLEKFARLNTQLQPVSPSRNFSECLIRN